MNSFVSFPWYSFKIPYKTSCTSLGIVLLDIQDYKSPIENLFADRSKFKQLLVDPTKTRLGSIQRFLRKLLSNGELSEETYKSIVQRMRNQLVLMVCPKFTKHLNTFKFRPIIDTTGSAYYSVGKYLFELLCPLTNNEFTLKDSFDTANKIRNIPPELFNDHVYGIFLQMA